MFQHNDSDITATADLSHYFLSPTDATSASMTGQGDSGGLAEAANAAVITALVVICFVVCKNSFDCFRQWRVRLNVVVIGSGPIGLSAALIAANSKRVGRIVVYEELNRAQLISRPQQIALDPRSVAFLRKYRVDFDNMEGCWHKERFYTRIGIFQEYMMSSLQRSDANVTIKLGTKFREEVAASCGSPTNRTMVIIADGINGKSCNLFGVSDEFVVESCKSFGAACSLERKDQPQVPSPEVQVNKLKLDLSGFGNEYRFPDLSRAAFYLKIFGTFRHRYISLVCHKCDIHLIRQLRITPDPMIMRNIFQESFNSYRTKSEPKISDSEAFNIQCNQRLSEVKLSYRRENVLYIQEENLVVTVEGDAVRSLNYNLGFEVNMGLRGLECMASFIEDIVTADNQSALVKAMSVKTRFSHQVNKEIVQSRLYNTLGSNK
ncbi:uncharacterized protein LOC110974694 [Acanthaster planci]|uniref:Uncharacterized protein LOC110974694 n=1 Tax=Acanthaster planci TaxID=133434 RepID=A0A8B7XQ96_ACAPL|nr:uncharacterized protein LOC110974694 [Acanthaster planci]